MQRNVIIDGVIYSSHELVEIDTHVNDFIQIGVKSFRTEDAESFEPLYTYHNLNYEDGMTLARAEELTWALPFFVEYVDKNEVLEDVLEILTDEQASEVIYAFDKWKTNVAYKVGDRVKYEDNLYKCLQAHTSQIGWEPTAAASLWAKVNGGVDPSVIPEWEQPDSTNPYMNGDHVMHNGKEWISTVDNNVWEPGVYGWDEV